MQISRHQMQVREEEEEEGRHDPARYPHDVTATHLHDGIFFKIHSITTCGKDSCGACVVVFFFWRVYG